MRDRLPYLSWARSRSDGSGPGQESVKSRPGSSESRFQRLAVWVTIGGMESTATKVIQLEFNELCPSLMEQFIGAGRLPNFTRLRRESVVMVTDAGEDAPNLEPWIQWITVHTGLPFSEHAIFDLGDGHKLNVPRIWDMVGETGRKVWICGSMNASFRKPIQGFILPDPWTTGIAPYPDDEFDAFFNFIRANVQEHTRSSMPVTKADQLRFLAFMVKRGMRADTVWAIIRQLASESKTESKWKRAAILDRLLFDAFAWYWKRHQPAFSTFFLNSTAHFQHMYWRNMAPELFNAKPGQSEQDAYANAIRFGYEQMDVLVGKVLAVTGPDTTIVLTTALSQQPCLKYENTGGKTFYRPNDPQSLFRFAGIGTSPKYAPVMSEQFHLYFDNEVEAKDASEKLQALRSGGQTVMMARHEGSQVFAGCNVFVKLDATATVSNGQGASESFEKLFYNCNLVKSGMHHRDGIFWVRNRHQTPKAIREKVPLTAVAPTLLSLLDVPQPSFVKGRALLSRPASLAH
jgi:hypothetical protein